MHKLSNISLAIRRVVASPRFFWFILALFAVQAIWLAVIGAYPMPFDEEFHLGIIKLYSQHISPFWQGNPAGGEVFGVVARDPSYLYQYIMGFPFRLISHFTNDITVQVMWLRAINIALFGIGIYLFRRLLLLSKASQAIVNGILLAFVLIPVVPLLASQINYDNLFIPLVGLVLIYTVQLSKSFSKSQVDLVLLLKIVILSLLTSLVKYAFLPLLITIFLFLGYRCWQNFKNFSKLKQALFNSFKTNNLYLIIGLSILVVISGALFIERYAINSAKYHSPIPECSKVLSIEKCKAYGPWLRDNNFTVTKQGSSHNPIKFETEWLYGMWLRLFFALGGPRSDYATRSPFPLPGTVAIVVLVTSVPTFLYYSRRIWQKYDSSVLTLFAASSVLYVVVLWLDEFKAYIKTGQPVAINGRYLLPILLFVFLFAALAYNELLKNKIHLKVALFVIIMFSLSYGGGALTYILRSQPSWLWPNTAIQSSTKTIQQRIGPLIIGSSNPNQFIR